jgi:DNA-3-methyladenine glycosylase II
MTHTIAGTLPAKPPFDFDKTLDFLRIFAPMEGEQTLGKRALTKAVLVGDQIVIFQIAPGGTAEPGLSYTLFSDVPIGADTRSAAEDRIAFFLSLNDDLEPFYALAEADERFAPVARKLRGYHQVKFLKPFENACWAALTQHNPIAAAKQTKQAINERYGASLEVGGERFWAFPTATRLADAGLAELRELTGHDRRAEYVLAIAMAFAGADERWLRAAPYDEVAAWLRAIKGLGAWSTTFVMLRGLGRMERLPVGEARLGQSAARVYGPALSEAEVEALAEHYGDYRGYWAHYLRVGAE